MIKIMLNSFYILFYFILFDKKYSSPELYAVLNQLRTQYKIVGIYIEVALSSLLIIQRDYYHLFISRHWSISHEFHLLCRSHKYNFVTTLSMRVQYVPLLYHYCILIGINTHKIDTINYTYERVVILKKNLFFINLT